MEDENIEVSRSVSARNLIIKVIQEQVMNQLPMYADKEHFLYMQVLNKAVEDYFSENKDTKQSAERYFFRRFDKENDIFELHAYLIGSNPDWLRYELKKMEKFQPRLDAMLKEVRGKETTRRQVMSLLSSLKS